MDLTLTYPDQPAATVTAELERSRGAFLSGTLRFDFKGPFPGDPKPFMSEPPPPAPADGGWMVYEVGTPQASVTFKTDTHSYLCRVEAVRPDGFTLSPFVAANLKAAGMMTWGDKG